MHVHSLYLLRQPLSGSIHVLPSSFALPSVHHRLHYSTQICRFRHSLLPYRRRSAHRLTPDISSIHDSLPLSPHLVPHFPLEAYFTSGAYSKPNPVPNPSTASKQAQPSTNMSSAVATGSLAEHRAQASLDVLPAELQNTIMEEKFAQIKQQRQDARTVLHEAKQRTRNQQTDQQILLLMQADERLAALLSQAADSMRALLPPVAHTDPSVTTPASPAADSTPAHGAKAFEDKAQQWFSILNEVQYSLRSVVRYLRQAQLSPITPPVGPDARLSGRAGSAGRGHNLSLLEAFTDIAGLPGGTTFKLQPLHTTTPSAPSASSSLSTILPESNLSLQALRERQSNWKTLSGSLHQIHQSMIDSTADGSFKTSPELSLLENIKNGCSCDRILIDALVNTNNVA